MIHVLLVTFPAQGHINPSLQFAKRLSKLGVKVTFLTSLSAIRRMSTTSSTVDALINFVSFTDGYDNGWSTDEAQNFMSALRNHGSKAVEDAIRAKREEGHPFTRVIYTLLVPWAGQVASHLQIPYFDAARSDEVIKLPGLPVFEPGDLPSFLFPSNTNIYDFALPTLSEDFEVLDRENSPIVLVNTFQALEPGPLSVIDKYKLMAIGPLIPSAFLDGKDPSDTSFGGDLIQKSVDYVQWLDSKEKSSTTNAKLIQDYWRTGVNVRKSEDGGLVKADEIERCLEIVMDGGERGEEMRREARKWRDLAKEAAKEGGTSYVNLKTFADQVLGADTTRY
ncbi:UNVERIFIED_CONTAM: UDP-glycosyltransferase 75C1 [Sesamum angustifolium]|uniref:UDP-glycosyltransferase 75C1 n=1 Tax=Sesamum angustifolium TaxID=2727405 RepID=A0AAW2MKT1_9LAMI